MLFNSIHYLFFFPVVMLLYFALPLRFRNGMLLIASYYFYMSWIPRYAVLILFSTASTYAAACLIDAMTSRRKRTAALAANIAVNLLILAVFKYSSFIVELTNAFLAGIGADANLAAPSLLLPVGISFYTFQSLGYSIDVYRRTIPHEKNFITYALFVSFFPQLVAGPIERATNLLPQFKEVMTFEHDRAVNGMRRILVGMFKKVVVADFIAEFVNGSYAHFDELAGITLLLATVLFAVQIYCDFSGYSDIAIGSAEVLGFRLCNNFRTPYFSSSIGEFWSRWHISLSTWFRDYVYIPLGGNRVTPSRRCLNTFITFAISGLWHGAGLNFIAWGTVHGLYRVAEIVVGLPPPNKALTKNSRCVKFAKTICIFFLVCLAWVFFRAPGIEAAFRIFHSIFTNFDPSSFNEDCTTVLAKFGNTLETFILMGCVIFPVLLFAAEHLSLRKGCGDLAQYIGTFGKPFRWTLYLVATLTIVFIYIFENGIYGQTGQFIYFQF